MTWVHPARRVRPTPTWNRFKSEVRKADRDSLLLEAAALSAIYAKGDDRDEWKPQGVTPWTIADVARTALAWGGPSRRSDRVTLARLCHMNALLIDEEGTSVASSVGAHKQPVDESIETLAASGDRLARILARTFFEQFPGQRSIMSEVARSILLFGSAAEFPADFEPKVMSPGWFERLTNGIIFDDYVESVFLFSILAQQQNGLVSVGVLDSPALRELADVFPLDAARRVFSEHLVTTVDAFKRTNRRWQDHLPPAEKKFAFNPLTEKPFIEGVAPVPVAPWVQAIITKALPPSIYFLPPSELRKAFADDLGPVFQHYAGRQLQLVCGERKVIPEVRYKAGKQGIDSCDWFLDLPDVLVLIECKSRQPVESLRVGGTGWLRSIEDSIGKGIRQLNRSNADIDLIGSSCPQIDSSKPRVGIIVTLEPFYLNQNWLIRERLEQAELPVGVLAIGELESLVLVDAETLGQALLAAAGATTDHVMLLNPALDKTDDRKNPLLARTWESIGLFARIDRLAERLGEPPKGPPEAD